jgi:ATP synthase protein I
MAEPDDDEALRAKLTALKGALDRRKADGRIATATESSNPAATASAMSMGMRAAGEFAGSIVVGVLVGWRLDVWLGTKPILLIVFFLLGSAAGILGVIRVTSPKSPQRDRDSRLSDGQAPDKDVRRSAPAAETKAPEGADDDEG